MTCITRDNTAFDGKDYTGHTKKIQNILFPFSYFIFLNSRGKIDCLVPIWWNNKAFENSHHQWFELCWQGRSIWGRQMFFLTMQFCEICCSFGSLWSVRICNIFWFDWILIFLSYESILWASFIDISSHKGCHGSPWPVP